VWTRWCCSKYKENGGRGLFKVVGVRIAESPRRARLWREFAMKLGSLYLAPICYWTDSDVWDFIHGRSLPYCGLYDEGFKRLGCIGCPFAADGRRKQFERWPRYEALWKRGARRYFEARHGTVSQTTGGELFINRFGSFGEYWQWWMDGADKSDKPLCLFEEQFLGLEGGGTEGGDNGCD
jgi:phosphoadenosine phosphosulfate reductase